MLLMALALWLGLGRKPEERPEVEEGERDGAALLLGELRGLLEVEQPRMGASWRGGTIVIHIQSYTTPEGVLLMHNTTRSAWIQPLAVVCWQHITNPRGALLL
jgi:hypothetical protein